MINLKTFQGFIYNYSWLGADLLTFCAYLFFLPEFTALFERKSLLHGFVVFIIYLTFCTSVFFIRKLLGPAAKSSSEKKGWLAFFAVNFGIFITYIIAEVSGFIQNLDKMPATIEGPAALLVLLGFALWLIVAFLYMIIVIIKVKPYFADNNPGTRLVEFLSVLGINLMVLTITAFWNSYFANTEPYTDLTLGGKLLIFLVTYLFFLLFFAPPRMLFILKKKNRLVWISFLLQTSYFVWDSLSRLAWQ